MKNQRPVNPISLRMFPLILGISCKEAIDTLIFDADNLNRIPAWQFIPPDSFRQIELEELYKFIQTVHPKWKPLYGRVGPFGNLMELACSGIQTSKRMNLSDLPYDVFVEKTAIEKYHDQRTRIINQELKRIEADPDKEKRDLEIRMHKKRFRTYDKPDWQPILTTDQRKALSEVPTLPRSRKKNSVKDAKPTDVSKVMSAVANQRWQRGNIWAGNIRTFVEEQVNNGCTCDLRHLKGMVLKEMNHSEVTDSKVREIIKEVFRLTGHPERINGLAEYRKPSPCSLH